MRSDDAPLWPFVSPNLYTDVNCILKTLAVIEKIVEREQLEAVLALDCDRPPPWYWYRRGMGRRLLPEKDPHRNEKGRHDLRDPSRTHSPDK